MSATNNNENVYAHTLTRAQIFLHVYATHGGPRFIIVSSERLSRESAQNWTPEKFQGGAKSG